MRTTTVGGFTIPKDSVIISSLDSVQMSETIWGDPAHFRPERFLDNHGNMKKQTEELIPFSIGMYIVHNTCMLKAYPPWQASIYSRMLRSIGK